MEGQVASLNAAAAGTVVLYEALRQRRRNVPPADTRTPPPVREMPVTPQEEDMGEEVEMAEEAEPSEADAVEQAEPAPVVADRAPRSEFAADEEELAEVESDVTDELAPEATEGSVEAAPKKRTTRAPRATKKTTTRKTTVRKKTSE
jgi:hypothetical protein